MVSVELLTLILLTTFAIVAIFLILLNAVTSKVERAIADSSRPRLGRHSQN